MGGRTVVNVSGVVIIFKADLGVLVVTFASHPITVTESATVKTAVASGEGKREMEALSLGGLEVIEDLGVLMQYFHARLELADLGRGQRSGFQGLGCRRGGLACYNFLDVIQDFVKLLGQCLDLHCVC